MPSEHMASRMEGVNRASRPQKRFRSSSRSSPYTRRKTEKSVSLLKAGEELKFYDLAQSVTPTAPTAGRFGGSWVAGIQAGASDDERIGRRIAITSASFKISGSPGYDAGPLHHGLDFRVIVFYDKSPNGTDPAVTDVLTSDNINAFKNLTNESRFQILHDGLYNVHPPADNADATKVFTWYKKFAKPLVVEFSASTGAVSDVRTGNINFLVFATYGPATGANSFTGYSRVRYVG